MLTLLYEDGGVNSSGRSQGRASGNQRVEDVEVEDDDFEAFDGIDAEQLRQMMSDPRYAALFAEHCKKEGCCKSSYRWKHVIP